MDILAEEFNGSKVGICKVTECGNVTEIMEMERKNRGCATRKLNANEYLVIDTGEVKEYTKTDNRAENSSAKSRFAKSMKELRNLINCNCIDTRKCRWMTLTYAENMTDTKRLYDDRKSFWKRVLYWHKKNGLSVPEYISVVEPQGRGAWHLHELWIYPCNAPFLPNEAIRELWQHGFVTVKKLDEVDNVGAYLTAYLCDVPVEEYDGDLKGIQIKTAEVKDEESGNTLEKKYVKGGRLHMYPAGMNFYRSSRGVKRPVVQWTSKERAKEKVKAATLTYSKTIRLISDDENFTNDIKYDYYNTVRKKTQ